MRVFVIGVAGAGMAPLAGILRQAGYEVRGSDVAFDPPMGPRLASWGVETCQGTDPSLLDGLDPAQDLVVVGNVCRRDHPLAVAAEQRGLRRVSLPTALRELVFTTASAGRPRLLSRTTRLLRAHLSASASGGNFDAAMA